MYIVGTVRIPRLKNFPLMAEKDLKKQGRGAIDFRVKTNSNIIAVKQYVNQAVTLISPFVGIDPIAETSRYDHSVHEKVAVNPSNIVKVYNTFTGGVYKIDMVCSQNKQTVRSRRWYVYIWLHYPLVALCLHLTLHKK